MKGLIAFVLLFTVAGCTTVCELAKSGATALAPVISSPEVLNCTGTAAIQSWLDSQLVKLNVCSTSTKVAKVVGFTVNDVGSLVCAPLVAILSDTALKQIPPDWSCAGGVLTDSAKAKLLAACLKAL
jgi:hypothetical protein